LTDVAHGSPKPVCEGGLAESAGVGELCREKLVQWDMTEPAGSERIPVPVLNGAGVAVFARHCTETTGGSWLRRVWSLELL
jgi:hypothetical protein